MSKMGVKKAVKKEAPISDETYSIRQLDVYRQHYESFYQFRKDRRRAFAFYDGKQWSDMTIDGKGNVVREDIHILNQGKLPLVQNIIKSSLRSIIGQFMTDTSKPIVVSRTPDKTKEAEMLSNALQCSLNTTNYAKIIDAGTLEELANSGMAIQKIKYERMPSKRNMDCIIENEDPSSMFMNRDIKDVRGFDIRVIGQLHDFTLDNVVLMFANNPKGGYSPEREAKIRDIYSATDKMYVDSYGYEPENNDSKDFYVPNDISKCRVIEVWEERIVKVMIVHDWMNGTEDETDWTQADLDRLNANRITQYGLAGVPPEEVPLYEGRWEKVKKWYFTFYSPYGHILREGLTPFSHGLHPYIVYAMPLINGRIAGLTPDMIDSQKQVNRFMVLYDMILGSSVKNTLVVDKDSLDGQSPESIGADYKEIGGVVVWDSAKGTTKPPFELKGSTGNFGLPEMIQLYVKFMQDISGVHPAMQGQQAPAGTSGVLFAQQAQNSTMNSKYLLESYTSMFLIERNMKLLKTIQQYYDTPRMLAISGSSFSDTAQLYDPKMVKDIEWDMAIGQSPESPVYRNLADQTLVDFTKAGLLDVITFFENANLPGKEQILESLRRRSEQAAQDPRGAISGMSSDINNVGLGANQQMVDKVYNATKAA